jgi:hypothetical protein
MWMTANPVGKGPPSQDLHLSRDLFCNLVNHVNPVNGSFS